MARLRMPPKSAFPHEINYKEPTGKADKWNKPEYSEPLNLEHVRFDESFDFKRNGVNANEDMPNALIALLKKYNKNMPEFKTKGVITYKGKEFTVLSVVPLYFTSDEPIGYELEVK